MAFRESKEAVESIGLTVPREFDKGYRDIKEVWDCGYPGYNQFALWKISQCSLGYILEDAWENRVENETLTDWVFHNGQKAIDAITYGYTVKERSVWVVRVPSYNTYFKGFLEEKDNEEINSENTVRSKATKFFYKDEAEAVATLTGGTVEEWSE